MNDIIIKNGTVTISEDDIVATGFEFDCTDIDMGLHIGPAPVCQEATLAWALGKLLKEYRRLICL